MLLPAWLCPVQAVAQTFPLGWDPVLMTAPRPSPMPIGFDNPKTFHRSLVQLPEGGLGLSFVDVLLPGGSQPLVIKRQYRSGLREVGSFGIGWSSNIDVGLIVAGDKFIRISEGDGRVTRYDYIAPELYTSDVGTMPSSYVRQLKDGWLRERTNGERELFDGTGRIVLRATGNDAIAFGYASAASRQPSQIVDAAGHIAKLTYADGLLVQVDYSLARTLRYAYQNRRLTEVVDAIGRKTSFVYAAGKLSEMLLPLGAKVTFAYGNDTTLREVSGPGPLHTTLSWATMHETADIRLTATSAVGSSQTLDIAPSTVAASDWGIGAKDQIALKLTEMSAGGLTSNALILPDKVLVDEGGKRRVLEPGKPAAAAPSAKSGLGVSSVDQWRAQFSPAKAPSGDPHIQYDGAGRAVAMTLSDGSKESWRWDPADRIVEWIDAEGSVSRYDYDELDHVVRITVDGVVRAAAEYNETGVIARVAGGYGAAARFTYDGAANLVGVTDESGRQIQYVFDNRDRPVEVRVDGKTERRLTYDDAGRLTTLLDADGATTLYRYDASGNVVETMDERGRKTSYLYDRDQLAKISYADGSSVAVASQQNGRTVALTDAKGQTATAAYDTNGGLCGVALPSGARHRYDCTGILLERQDADGKSRQYQYEAKGLSRIRRPDGDVVRYDYDVVGRVTAASYDSKGQTVGKKYKYDDAGHLIEVAHEDGTTEKYFYDRQSRVMQYVNRLGVALRYSYDASGRRVRTESPLGVESLEYDQFGRITKREDPMRGLVQRSYSSDGKSAKSIDPGGATTAILLDDNGRPLTVTDAVGGKSSYRYNAAGQIIARTDQNGGETVLSYDDRGQLIERRTAGGRLWQFKYDDQGHLIQSTAPGGTIVTSNYDRADRPAHVTSSDGAAWDFAYDGRGRPTVLRGAAGAATYIYDALDRPLQYRDAAGATVGMTYDAVGRPQTLQKPDGRKSTYSYNTAGLLSRIVTDSGASISYAYDSAGRLSTIAYPNGTQTSFGYVAGTRLQFIKTASAQGRMLLSESYEYDSRGNVTAVVSEGSVAESQAGFNRTFGRTEYRYDALSRVIEAAFPDGLREQFKYDATGSVIEYRAESVTSDGTHRNTMVPFGYDADQALAQYEGRAVAPDASGNLCPDPNGAHCSAQYDAFNRLIVWRNERYGYDAEGRLVDWGDNQGRGAHLVYFGGQLIAETPSGGAPASIYTPGMQNGLWVSLRVGAEEYFPIRSANGSLLALLDKAGSVVEACRYRTFGVVDVSWSAKSRSARCEFAGGRQVGAGVVFGSRVLSPIGFRFMSPDPAGPDRDGNLYSYALDNPLRFSDFNGSAGSPLPPNTPMPHYKGPIIQRLEQIAAGNTPGRDVAKNVLDQIKQGTLDIKPVSSAAGRGGAPDMGVLGGTSSKPGNIVAQVFTDPHIREFKNPLDVMTQTAVHEAKHVEQNLVREAALGGNEYRRIHEVEAALAEWRLDPTMGTGKVMSRTELVDRIAKAYDHVPGSDVMRQRTIPSLQQVTAEGQLQSDMSARVDKLKRLRAEQAVEGAERVPGATSQAAARASTVETALAQEAVAAETAATEARGVTTVVADTLESGGSKLVSLAERASGAIGRGLARLGASPIVRLTKLGVGALGEVLMLKDLIDFTVYLGRTVGEAAADLYLGLKKNRITDALDKLANDIAAIEKTDENRKAQRKAQRAELLGRLSPEAVALMGEPGQVTQDAGAQNTPASGALGATSASTPQPAAPSGAASAPAPRGPILPLGQSGAPSQNAGARPGGSPSPSGQQPSPPPRPQQDDPAGGSPGPSGSQPASAQPQTNDTGKSAVAKQSWPAGISAGLCGSTLREFYDRVRGSLGSMGRETLAQCFCFANGFGPVVGGPPFYRCGDFAGNPNPRDCFRFDNRQGGKTINMCGAGADVAAAPAAPPRPPAPPPPQQQPVPVKPLDQAAAAPPQTPPPPVQPPPNAPPINGLPPPTIDMDQIQREAAERMRVQQEALAHAQQEMDRARQLAIEAALAQQAANQVANPPPNQPPVRDYALPPSGSYQPAPLRQPPPSSSSDSGGGLRNLWSAITGTLDSKVTSKL
ncbi:DUF6531 domain-containing protein [Bradyrhizobium erythrophlei]|uniref:DUF6531 domain-containing protein n=1 Tax=Bradyrhizobium erythrophlei TaxID=1437360 RepID=UPI0035E4B4F5